MSPGAREGADDYLQIERHSQQRPRDVALASPGRDPLIYSRLWDQISTASHFLSAQGIQPGEIVALATPTGPTSITAVLSITLRSACAPLDPALTRDEYRALLPRIGASTLVFSGDLDSPLVDTARELGMRLIELRVSPHDSAGVFTLDEIDHRWGNRPGRVVDAKLLLQTSATTGAPKLVPRTLGSVVAAAEQDVRALELSSSDRYLSLIPLNIGHGLTMAFSHFLCGAAVFCAPGFEADAFSGWLREFRPTWLAAGTSISRMILGLGKQNPRLFSDVPLRFACSLGAAPEANLIFELEKLLGVPVLDEAQLRALLGQGGG